jgi:hypothetical protein
MCVLRLLCHAVTIVASLFFSVGVYANNMDYRIPAQGQKNQNDPPLQTLTIWNKQNIEASRSSYLNSDTQTIPNSSFKYPKSWLLVLEQDLLHANLIDSDQLEKLHRFPIPANIQGGMQFSPDAHYLYWVTEDGWVHQYDSLQARLVAKIRVGLHSNNLALSSNGRFLMVANSTPHTLVALDARTMDLLRVIEVKNKEGKSSAVVAVFDAPTRQSFVAALQDLPEIWELIYDASVGPIYAGLVHDYQMGEGIAVQGPFPEIRIKLNESIGDFFLSQNEETLLGRTHQLNGKIVDLDLKRQLASVELPKDVQFNSLLSWSVQSRDIMAISSPQENSIHFIDSATGKTIKQLSSPFPIHTMRSHPNTNFAWVHSSIHTNKARKAHEQILILDKQKLEISGQIRLGQGQKVKDFQFTPDARLVVVSMEDEADEQLNALHIYDASSGKEIKRIPMNIPAKIFSISPKSKLPIMNK